MCPSPDENNLAEPGSGAFETVLAVLVLIPKTARWEAGLTVAWMTPVILSHIFVLGYGWFFVDALRVIALARRFT